MNLSFTSNKHLGLLVVIALLLAQTGSAGISRKWIATNEDVPQYWSSPFNWSPYGVPQTGDQLEFTPGYVSTVIVNVAPPVLGRINVRAGLYITFVGSGADRSITLSSPDTALYVAAASGGLIRGNLWISNSTGTEPIVTLKFSGTGNKAIVNGQLFVGVRGAYDATNSNTIVGGYMTHGYGGNGGPIYSNSSNLRFIAAGEFDNGVGNGTIPYATWDIGSICTLQSSTNVGLDQSFGHFNVYHNSGGDFDFEGKLQNIKGNLYMSSSYVGHSFVFTTNTPMTLNIGGNFTIADYSTTAIPPLTKIIFTNGSASPVINVAGTFSKFTGVTRYIEFGSGTGAATLNVKGDFGHSGVPIRRSGTGSNGQINFNGYSQYLLCDSSDRINYTVMPGSTVTMQSNQGGMVLNKTLATGSGSFTVGSGGKLYLGTNVIRSLTGGANAITSFNLNSGATLATANTAGVTQAGGGSIQTNYRYYSTGANYLFNGTQPQVTGLLSGQSNNLTISNPAGVSASGPFRVAGTLTVSLNSWLNTSNASILTLLTNALVNNSGGYVAGPIQKVGNQPVTFPVGSASNKLVSIGMSAPPVITDTVMAEYINSSAAAIGSILATGLNRVSNCDYWKLTYKGTGSPSLNITARWNQYNAPCVNITSTSLVVLARWYHNAWTSYGNNVVTGTTTSGSVTWNNVTSFGYFALGMKNAFIFSKTPAVLTQERMDADNVDAGNIGGNGVAVRPVPSTGTVYLNANAVKGAAPVVLARISTLNGQMLQTIRFYGKEQRVSLAQSGIYLVSFLTEDGNVVDTKRIVIAK